MNKQLSDFPKLAAPAQRALANAGIQNLKQLAKFSENEIKQLHGLGPNALIRLREALQSKGLAFAKPSSAGKATVKKKPSPVNRTDKVNAFMENLDHPFKAEVQMVRDIIKGVHKNITEEIKWKAPSFSYQGEYLATFNLWEKKRILLIFHNGAILKDKSGLLEGIYPDRRLVYFSDTKEIKLKKATLEKLIKQWIKLIDKRLRFSRPEQP